MSPERASRPLPRWALAALAATVALLYLAAELYVFDGRLGFPLDDAWIHLQFARNLAAGDGLSFNPGEPVTGSTAPLWTALLSVLFVLPGGPVVWTKLLGVALLALATELVYRLARDLDLSPGLSTLAAVAAALTEWLVWSALSGLEVPLFVVLSLIGIRAHLAERRSGGAPVSLAVLALSALARPEGQLLFLLASLDRLVRIERDGDGSWIWRRGELRPVLGGLAIALVLLAPVALFNLVVGGSLLPTTYGAKVPPPQSAGLGALAPSLVYLLRGPIDVLFRAQPFMLLLAGAGVVALAGRLGGARDRGLLPVTWLLGLPVAYAMLSGISGANVAGNFGRYFFPLFPILIVVAVAGLEGVAERLGGRARLPVRAALAVLLLWPAAVGTLRGAQRYVQTIGNVQDSSVRVAAWLAERVAPDAVLAVNDVGAFGYLLPNRIVDLAGILHPDATRLRYRASLEGRLPDEGTLEFLARERPDYLVIFPRWFPALIAEGSPFTPIERFEIPDNITMAGDEIVVYSTPWTRGRPLAPVENTDDG